MTGEEQRNLADSYLFGRDGLTKNVAKGWECMKQAADLGDAEACFRYAEHIVDTDHNGALNYLAKGGLEAEAEAGKSEYVYTYFTALVNRAKADPATAKDGYCKALAYENFLREWQGKAWYRLAELARLTGADKAEVKKYLVNANIGECDVSDNAVYAAYGMEKGVLEGGEQLERYLSRLAQIKSRKVFFVAAKKSESMARALIQAKLDENAGKGLGKKRIAAIKSSSPRGVLEYQRVIGQTEYLGTFTYGFKHQADNAVTYTTGSGEMNIDTEYITYGATFKLGIPNDDINRWIDKMEFSSELPDARVRVTVEREAEVSSGASMRQVSSYDVIKERIARKYNWHASDISLNNVQGVGENYRDFGQEDIYVPFWFFDCDVDGETVTARVNAFTGETDFYIDNKFGQLLPTDDVKAGGGEEDAVASGIKPFKFSCFLFLLLSCVVPFVGGIIYAGVWYAAKNGKK